MRDHHHRLVFLRGDVVRYRPRWAALTNWLSVQRGVERIFRYREQRLRELYAPRG